MSARNPRRLAVVLTLALITAACGGADDVVSEAAAVPTNTATEEVPPEPAGAAGDLEIITLEPGDVDVEPVTTSALGGIRFDKPVDIAAIVFEDVVVLTRDLDDLEKKIAFMMLTTQLPAGSRIDTAESYLDVIKLTHDVSPTGTAIVFEGFELTGYEITGSESVLSFAASRFPAPVFGQFGPANHAFSFIGETPSGVLDIGVGGLTREDAEAMLPVLGTALASLEFTGPGLDPALPPGEIIEPADAGPPPPPAESADDAPAPPLGPPFSPVEPGRYEVLNFGLPISLEVGENWFIQPNFPGVVVLTDPASGGPNDRDVVFLNSIAELVPLASGPVVAGDAIPIDDIEELLSNPPESMNVSDVERMVLTAENGSTTPVISFTVEMVSDSACSPTDPCQLGLVTSYGLVKQFRPTDDHRVWWFPEHPNGPAAAIASASADIDWMLQAEELMATLELSR